ncbi:hypothetical protein CDD83_5741 [Cordyceps sp. RAO-2017]|nr:hypothetical protein CDD83_5741 [Cordyceps sp. RAO-2017]
MCINITNFLFCPRCGFRWCAKPIHAEPCAEAAVVCRPGRPIAGTCSDGFTWEYLIHQSPTLCLACVDRQARRRQGSRL